MELLDAVVRLTAETAVIWGRQPVGQTRPGARRHRQPASEEVVKKVVHRRRQLPGRRAAWSTTARAVSIAALGGANAVRRKNIQRPARTRLRWLRGLADVASPAPVPARCRRRVVPGQLFAARHVNSRSWGSVRAGRGQPEQRQAPDATLCEGAANSPWQSVLARLGAYQVSARCHPSVSGIGARNSPSLQVEAFIDEGGGRQRELSSVLPRPAGAQPRAACPVAAASGPLSRPLARRARVDGSTDIHTSSPRWCTGRLATVMLAGRVVCGGPQHPDQPGRPRRWRCGSVGRHDQRRPRNRLKTSGQRGRLSSALARVRRCAQRSAHQRARTACSLPISMALIKCSATPCTTAFSATSRRLSETPPRSSPRQAARAAFEGCRRQGRPARADCLARRRKMGLRGPSFARGRRRALSRPRCVATWAASESASPPGRRGCIILAQSSLESGTRRHSGGTRRPAALFGAASEVRAADPGTGPWKSRRTSNR